MSGESVTALCKAVNKYWEINHVVDLDDHIEKLRRETFKAVGRVHDWRNYVPPTWFELWPSLSDETRFAIWALCDEQSHDEHWD